MFKSIEWKTWKAHVSPTELCLLKTQKLNRLSVPLLNGRQMPWPSLEQWEQVIGRLNAGQRPQLIAQAYNCNVVAPSNIYATNSTNYRTHRFTHSCGPRFTMPRQDRYILLLTSLMPWTQHDRHLTTTTNLSDYETNLKLTWMSLIKCMNNEGNWWSEQHRKVFKRNTHYKAWIIILALLRYKALFIILALFSWFFFFIYCNFQQLPDDFERGTLLRVDVVEDDGWTLFAWRTTVELGRAKSVSSSPPRLGAENIKKRNLNYFYFQYNSVNS
jgi:hypothetical protein